jgi:hypothetical protein
MNIRHKTIRSSQCVLDLLLINDQWWDPTDHVIVRSAGKQKQISFLAGMDDGFGSDLIRLAIERPELCCDH